MQINQCLHAAVLVTDLEKADRFYSQVLGLTKVERPLDFPGIWYQVGSFQIHLMVDAAATSTLVNLQKWGRNRHIAFAVDNLDAAKTKLLASGCPVQASASGRPAVFTQDPDGNVIELSAAI